jgi:ribonuclease HII
MYDEIVRLCTSVRVSSAEPAEIDQYVRAPKKYRRLNFLEAMHMAKIIDSLNAEEVYIDAPDTNPPRFTRELCELLSCKPKIVAEHRADSTYVVVSAASIIAKVERDKAVSQLREIHGDFGSGYPSDDNTIAFLRTWVEERSSRPDFSRKTWRTWEKVLAYTLDG